MFEIDASLVTPILAALFDAGLPAALRCAGVVDGLLPGQVWTDDLDLPTWAVVREAAFGALYPGGALDRETLCEIVSRLRGSGDVLLGMWADEYHDLLPPNPDYDGRVLDFTERSSGQPPPAYFQALPPGCTIRRVDEDLFDQCLENGLLVQLFGSKERALKENYGLCMVDQGKILCEAHAGPAVRGQIELGVVTHPEQRGKGYAALTCAHLIQWCEAEGLRTYWNCAAQNQASAALARSLGFRQEREYRLLAWFRISEQP